jgi:hypothetical protein
MTTKPSTESDDDRDDEEPDIEDCVVTVRENEPVIVSSSVLREDVQAISLAGILQALGFHVKDGDKFFLTIHRA